MATFALQFIYAPILLIMEPKEYHIRFYNGENDLAVANLSPYYQAPKRIEQMNIDLELLMIILSNDGDIIILRRAIEKEGAQAILSLLGYKVRFHILGEVFDESISKDASLWLSPWGWSPRAHFQLDHLKSLISREFNSSPISQWSEKLHEISGKGIVCDLLPSLLEHLEPYNTCFTPRKITSLEEFESELKLGKRVYKAPWSGSGKGVRFISSESCGHHDIAWVKSTLKQQGFITSAPYLKKVCDFAMQFEIDSDSTVQFIGYTRFHTGSHGAYQGNQIGSQELIIKAITEWVDSRELHRVTKAVTKLIENNISPYYVGYLGVDMMGFVDDGIIRIHPLVEINLRHTMGSVALKLYEKLLYKKSHGSLVIEYASTPDALCSRIESLSREYPLVIKDNRIESGFFELTYKNNNSLYSAYLIVNKG
ncbi:MAG: hypothetical protein ACRC6R_10330 [Bacteroidales bacterium]